MLHPFTECDEDRDADDSDVRLDGWLCQCRSRLKVNHNLVNALGKVRTRIPRGVRSDDLSVGCPQHGAQLAPVFVAFPISFLTCLVTIIGAVAERAETGRWSATRNT